MEYVIMAAIGIGAFVFGAYCFNSILVPVFYTIPRLRKEKANENLLKPVPMVKLVLVPIAAATVFAVVMYFSFPYYVDYPWAVFAGLAVALIGVYSKLKSTKGEKEADFIEDYGGFLVNQKSKSEMSKSKGSKIKHKG